MHRSSLESRLCAFMRGRGYYIALKLPTEKSALAQKRHTETISKQVEASDGTRIHHIMVVELEITQFGHLEPKKLEKTNHILKASRGKV